MTCSALSWEWEGRRRLPLDSVRPVCCAYNIARSDWPDDVEVGGGAHSPALTLCRSWASEAIAHHSPSGIGRSSQNVAPVGAP